MQITHFTRDGCLVVALTGNITVATAPQIQQELLKDLAEGPLAIICDLGGVDAQMAENVPQLFLLRTNGKAAGKRNPRSRPTVSAEFNAAASTSLTMSR